MRKYVYKNAVVYITEPTEDQMKNIKIAVERFITQLAKKGLLNDDKRRGNIRISNSSSRKRKGNRKTGKENRTN